MRIVSRGEQRKQEIGDIWKRLGGSQLARPAPMPVPCIFGRWVLGQTTRSKRHGNGKSTGEEEGACWTDGCEASEDGLEDGVL